MSHGIETIISENKRRMQIEESRHAAILRDLMNVILENSGLNEAGERVFTTDMNVLAAKLGKCI